MKSPLLILTLIIASTGLLVAQGSGKQHADSLREELIYVLNKVRSKPASFIPEIDRYRTHVKSFVKDVKALDKAVKEIKDRLRKQATLSALNMQGSLHMASQEHIKDIEANGVIGHIGSDGSDPLKRLQKFGKLSKLCENITYGHLTANMIIAALLVDEDTPGRGHRENLLNPDYVLVGIGIGVHKSQGRACVIMLGAP